MLQPEIRMLGRQESPEIFAALARLHSTEISDGFLTSLGTPLLSKLYQAISQCPQAFIVVADVGGNIVGFVCGSTDTRQVYRDVLSHTWASLLSSLVRRLFSWHTVRRCWETLRYPSRSAAPDLPRAEILNFCVTHRLQGSGIGRRLFAAMQTEFERRGIRQIRIVTGANQLSAIRFYEKLGAEPVGSLEVHARIESRVFRYAIERADAERHPSGMP